ncbi:MAG: SUMF1/EgtB/PvdO family nonheme iron enzyme [Planctomycetota bacterium]|nr:SUMF1/EgtB/PvdO family nonheme iron enzyme [Planctomycetota bacterium]
MKKLAALTALAAVSALAAWQLSPPDVQLELPQDPASTIAPFAARSLVPLPESLPEPEPAPKQPTPMPLPERLPLDALASSTPPGLILVSGGSYRIGLDRKRVTQMIESQQLRPLASEYPEHKVKLDDFFYMPTEVTNEQYAAFVEATGCEPPEHWAEQEAPDAGLPLPNFEVPPELADHPVVNVTHSQAEAFARWAGLRLVSEEEHQAVGRGRTTRAYPWGDDFDPTRANSVEAKLGHTAPVGSYPSGSAWLDERGTQVERTPENQDQLQGIHDLSGNVWEWTRSPFQAYPKFKPLVVKIQGSKERIAPEFDPDHHVAVSGDFGSPSVATRLTTRRGVAPWMSTSTLGLRCSASATPGEDLFLHVLASELAAFEAATGSTYRVQQAVHLQRWLHRRPASESLAGRPSTHRVILAHDHLAVIPVGSTGLADLAELERHSSELELGLLSTSIDLLEPRLVPGTYSVSYRAAGEGAGQPTLVLGDAAQELVAALPTHPPTLGYLLQGRASLQPRAAAPTTTEGTGSPAATLVHMELVVPTSVTDQGFHFRLPLATLPGAVDYSWLPE